MNNLYEEYLKFIEIFLIDYYRLILGDSYDKNIVNTFINKYIDIRYYNKCLYMSEPNFITRLNKELNLIAKEFINDNKDDVLKVDKIKNIYALFAYVLYFDGVYPFNDLNELLKSFYNDKNITFSYSEDLQKKLNFLVRNFMSKRNEFFNLFKSNEFYLEGLRLPDDVYLLELKHNLKLSKLYSDYAIEKAYNAESVIENRFHLSLLIVTANILNDSFLLKYNTNYIINFPISLFTKDKKINKYLSLLENDYVKNKIHLKVTYDEYIKNRSEINNLIKNNYSVCLEIDDTFDMNLDDLVLFTYVLVNKNYKYYNNVVDSVKDIKTTLLVVGG